MFSSNQRLAPAVRITQNPARCVTVVLLLPSGDTITRKFLWPVEAVRFMHAHRKTVHGATVDLGGFPRDEFEALLDYHHVEM